MKRESRDSMNDAKHRETIEIPCPDCDGMGYQIVSADMANDAGDREMVGAHWICSRCNGSGGIQVEVEKEQTQ